MKRIRVERFKPLTVISNEVSLASKEKSMESIVKVDMIQIKSDTEFPVDARQLHAWLGVGEKFTTWIAKRINECDFDAEIDYITFSEKPANSLGRSRQDYFISFDMAKELAMLEKNYKGKEARKYFIAAEKRLQSVVQEIQKPMSLAEQFLMIAQTNLEQEQKLNQVSERLNDVSEELKKVNAILHHEENFLTITAFFNLQGRKNITPEETKLIGMRASRICKEEGIPMSHVPNARWGKVNTYLPEVIKRAIQEVGLRA